jgi:uncharacterized MAPEG superfamily protein
MTTPLWCLLIATFLPFLWVFAGHVFRYRQFGNIDNNHPRMQQAQLTGLGARALAAQQNAWEALAMFTPAVLMAHLNGVTTGHVANAAVLFIAARVAHGCLYLANLSSLRSLIWMVGAGAVIWLFVLGVHGH